MQTIHFPVFNQTPKSKFNSPVLISLKSFVRRKSIPVFDPRPLCCSSLTTAVGETTDTNFVDSAHPTVARINNPYHILIIYRTVYPSYTVPYTHHKLYHIHFIDHTIYPSYSVPYNHHKSYHMPIIYSTMYPSYTIPYTHHKPYHMPIIYRTIYPSYTIPYTHHNPYNAPILYRTIYPSYTVPYTHHNCTIYTS